jgi:hypothetical protein
MSDWQLNTSVAFIIFNRPDTTELVFNEIAKAKPPKLLVVADGPRVGKEGEAEKCEATRAIINRVDWDCEVLTNYSEVNLGCKHRVASGLDWVFEQVPEAIILEDDCLPEPTFFRFCQELLERYRNDQRIGIISGDNFQFGRRRNNDSYYFSKYVHIWGWATWRDRWQGSYDVKLKNWPTIRDGGWLIDILGNKNEAKYWSGLFERVYQNKIDTWDYQWVLSNWLQGRRNVMPNVNLISNIGFGSGATHTVNSSPLENLAVSEICFPLTHPLFKVINSKADLYTYNHFFNIPLYKQLGNKVNNIFNKLISAL